ncbi:hypothetical protein KCP77_23330 [Salmonella enterica subsp. enterica]|nr:hypothetical protein KCP77_23330 [Salmonella enterica subsp. enterica]
MPATATGRVSRERRQKLIWLCWYDHMWDPADDWLDILALATNKLPPADTPAGRRIRYRTNLMDEYVVFMHY